MVVIHCVVAKNDPEDILDVSAEVKIEIDNVILKNDKNFALLLRKWECFEKFPEETQKEHVRNDKMLIRVKKVIIQKVFLISLFTLLQHIL